MYTFSVIIPTFNEEKNVENLILTIKKQTVQPNEIILADKSTDKTPNIGKSYGAKIVEGVTNFRLGISKNNGAKIATGEILFFFDADMDLTNDKYFENFLLQIENQNLDAAHGLIIPNNNTIFNIIGYKLFNQIRKIGPLIHSINYDTGSGIVVRKDAFFDVGGFREDIVNSEDILLLDALVKKGYKYRIINEKIIIDDRRMKKKSFFVLLLIALMIPYELYLKRKGFNNDTSRYLDAFSKIYQMNKFELKKLKKSFSYNRVD